MRQLSFLLPLIFIFFTACDPKVDQRAPRYDDTACPACNATGVCHVCKGTKECAQCHGTGVRTISTKNYGAEGLKLAEYTVECPFCNGDKTCHICNGTGACLQCGGDGKIDSDWKTITSDPRLITQSGENNE